MPYTIFKLDAEDIKNLLHGAKRRIPLAALNILDCGKTNLRHFRKILLGKREYFSPLFHYILQLHSLI
ncbi:MAG: hypothetical protein PUA94_06360 [Bacteroidales bacterium]|nr:hypothetical protein [Bacteroidales bacterium]